ncbi:MAG: hypothetical protein WCP32_12960, partial [Bacteroidota bacterium]
LPFPFLGRGLGGGGILSGGDMPKGRDMSWHFPTIPPSVACRDAPWRVKLSVPYIGWFEHGFK